MRRKTGLIGAALFALVSVMPVWAIWEGNAGIAASSEFTQAGFFAKSDMFPKNTLVEIENLETEITIRAVVVGPSGVPGLVAMLSPQAATALSVRPGSVSRVRISVPSPVSETPAAGTIAAGKGAKTPDPDVNPASASLEADALALSAPSSGDNPLDSLNLATQDPLVPLTPDAGDLEPAPELPEASEIAEIAEAAETAEAPEALESLEAPPFDGETAAAEIPAEEVAAPEIADVEMTAPPVELPLVAEVEPEAPETAPLPETSEAAPTVTVDSPSYSSYYDEPELSTEFTETPGETETVVTLEPAELMPPAAVPDVPAVVAAPPAAVAVPPAAVAAPAVSAAPPAAEAPKTSLSSSLQGLPLVSSLEKGKYYIQVASYTDPENARRLVSQWSSAYPIAVERTGEGAKNTLKVCVGPVGRDEYGAVLERFKAAGFRDAFVRAVK